MGGTGTTIGVLGSRWRGSVDAAGAVEEWSTGRVLSWWVAADDRWHVPAQEPAVRQRRLDGTPVVETRLRIPGGDAVHRTFAVADGGGHTIVQVTNESSLPIAVAFAGMALCTGRPRSDTRPAGIDLPADAIVLPVGHQATITVARAHDGRSGTLPQSLASCDQVVRGWTSTSARAGSVVVPDAAWSEALVADRCAVLLDGMAAVIEAGDEVDVLLAADQLTRLGVDVDEWLADVALATGRVLRTHRGWAEEAALDAAARVLVAQNERRALADLDAHRDRSTAVTDPAPLPADRPAPGLRRAAWIERRMAAAGALLPGGIPADWLGQSFEVHGVPIGRASTVSYAVRWHGARPAVLWEVSGEPVALSAPAIAPGWHAADARGETLWPAPQAELDPTGPTSFS